MLNLNENKILAEEHFNKVKVPIQTRVKKLLKAKKIKFKKKTNKISIFDLNLIKTYLNDKTLKDIITCDAISLDDKAKDLTKKIKNKNSTLYKIHCSIFIDNGYNKIKKDEFINNTNIDTCPYCNRNYIYCLDEKGKIKPEIDHFYPKSKYPIFASSFYNLIPCCQTCNGITCKYESDPIITKIKNPYLLKSNDFEFTFKLTSLPRIHPTSNNKNIDVKLITLLNGHVDVFKLDKLYEKHADHVLELIVKSKLKYSPKYRNYLSNYTLLKLSKTEIDRLILGNYSNENELHKRPLSKLYRDIGKKLGLI